MLNEKEFLQKISELDVTLYYDSKDGWNDRKFRPKNDIRINDYLYAEWVIGGETGGSCWGDGTDDPHRPIRPEEEPNFDCFDKILLCIVPNISYLQYKVLSQAVLRTDDYTRNEYYGNYTVYGIKKVVLKDLYNKLIEMGLV